LSSLDDLLWMDYVSSTPKVLVATSGSRGSLRDVADPAPCGGFPAHTAATELPTSDVPTEATASAVRPTPVDAQLTQLTSATLPVGGAFSNVPGKGPGSSPEGVHGSPGSHEPPSADAVSPDLVILQEAHAQAAMWLAAWEYCWPTLTKGPDAHKGRAEATVALRSALAALHAWKPAIALATPSSDGSFRRLSSEPLVSTVVSELASLGRPCRWRTHTIAAPDVCCLPAAPFVAPASAVGSASVDLHLAHHTLGSGDFSPSTPPIDSSRRPIGGPAAIVAPNGIVYTPGTATSHFAEETSFQATLALEARVASYLAVPAFGGTHTIAAPDVRRFPAVPFVAPVSAVGPTSAHLHLAHHMLGSGDSSPSPPPIDSCRSPIGAPVASVAPIGIAYTSGTFPGMPAAEASSPAILALEARVAEWAARPVFPLHNAPPA
jgi:hypothetical protein